MEIRPYRSQVREAATREPVERVDTARAQTYAAYEDMISKAGQTASSSLYQWNDAIEKRRDQDRKIAYQAGVQEIDVLFAELGKAMDDDMAKREQDPFAVFDADTKNALNEVYTYHVNSIKDRTVGRAPDPETKAMLDLYFRAKKLEAGASVEKAIKTHTDNIAATVMGKANAGLVDTAIAGDEKDIKTSMKGIEQNLGILAERGVISRAQIAENLQDAKNQIEFGRAKNQVDVLDYKTGQEFINQVPVSDGNRKNLQDYFKDKWSRQKNIWEKEAGDTFEQGLDMYTDGTLTREWIYAQTAFELHPEVGMTTDYRKILVGLLDKQDEALAREAAAQAKAEADKAYKDTFDGFYQRIEGGDISAGIQSEIDKSALSPRDKEWLKGQIDESGKKASEGEKEKKNDRREAANRVYRIRIDKDNDLDAVWNDILGDVDLTSSDVDTLQRLIDKRRGGTKEGKGAAPSTGFSTLYDALSNPYMTNTERLIRIAQWASDNPDDAKNPDIQQLYKNVKQGNLITDPRVVQIDGELETRAKDLYKEGKDDQAKAIDTIRRSVLHTIAADMWYTEDAKGNKIPVAEEKRQEMLADAIASLERIKAMTDITDPFRYHYTGDPPKIDITGKDYGYSIDFREGGYERVKKNVYAAHLLQDIAVVTNDIQEMRNAEAKALDGMGIDLNGYEYKFLYIPGKGGNMYFYNPDKDDAYCLDYNDRKKLNAYHITLATGDREVVTPPVIREVVDTKKALKEARKEEAKKWAAEMDELTDIDKVVK